MNSTNIFNLMENEKTQFAQDIDFINTFVFKTDSNNSYIYDNNSSYLLPVNDVDIDLIKFYSNRASNEMLIKYSNTNVVESINHIKSAITCGMFKKLSMIPLHVNTMEELYKAESMSLLILILGENCNMRCTYCIFGDCYEGIRAYENQSMSFDTAKTAIDIFYSENKEKKHYGNSQEFGLIFYGGEPLLYFNVMKKIVEYIEASNYDMAISLTTNGTLLDDEICEFIIEKNITVTISLDGDAKETNRKRLLKNGSGAFEVIMNNTRKLNEKYKEQGFVKPQIFNSCIDYKTNISEVESFFEKLPMLKFVGINPISDYYTTYYDQFTKEEKKLFNSRNDKKRNELIQKEINEDKTSILRNSFLLRHHSFRTRITNPPYSNYLPCIPGSRIAVNPDGNFYMCERMNQQFPIGNIKTGINYARITELCQLLFDVHNKHCSKCNVSRLCSLCFSSIINNNEFAFDKTKCKSMREYTKKVIYETVSAMEKNPNSFLYEFREVE